MVVTLLQLKYEQRLSEPMAVRSNKLEQPLTKMQFLVKLNLVYPSRYLASTTLKNMLGIKPNFVSNKEKEHQKL